MKSCVELDDYFFLLEFCFVSKSHLGGVPFVHCNFAPLMLWRAIKTQDHVVGNSGQGMYWQGSDKNPPTG